MVGNKDSALHENGELLFPLHPCAFPLSPSHSCHSYRFFRNGTSICGVQIAFLATCYDLGSFNLHRPDVSAASREIMKRRTLL
jgi:hypothetical protein